MWPFSRKKTMEIKKLDDRFAIAAQIRPEEVEVLAAKGYRLIVCNRPDGEDPGQPAFSEIAAAAKKNGITAVHIPVTGAPTGSQVETLRAALATTPGLVLGYCRSGGRAGRLYAELDA